jgi:CheY-like chemotaxis protein/anti-sigma regulatory factor (Ser/Thr protein kinase)
MLSGCIDSSRRAVEAADNVVHAYDLNMQMPEVSLTPNESECNFSTVESGASQVCPPSPLPPQFREFSSSPLSKKRERSEEMDFHPGPPLKRMFTMTEAEILATYYSPELNTISGRATTLVTETVNSTIAPSEIDCVMERDTSEEKQKSTVSNPNHRRIILRGFMRGLVNEALRNGHPTKEMHHDTELGEMIEFRTLGPRGEIQDRTIFLEIDSDVPLSIVTEEQQLQFALQKLIDNAIKFTEDGQITITVKINTTLHTVEIRILDTGCGISEESKTNLFKPHFQEDASISRAKDGLGLSLFNAKAHVRKNLGGDVTLERSATEGPSKGSEFLIRLPLSALESGYHSPSLGLSQPARRASETGFTTPPYLTPVLSDANAKDHQPSVKGTPRKRVAFNPNLGVNYPLNILIAEDNAINRNVALGSLNKLGYKSSNITVAFDGLEAVDHYRASLDRHPTERFNCVLMDIWMPNMDGYEATTTILKLARENGEEIKILAVTADITDESVQRAKMSGMQGFLAKPYKVLDIEHLIVEHFQPSC